MADYDTGEITERERTAAKRQKEIADYSGNTLKGIADYNEATAKNVAQYNVDQALDNAAWNAIRTHDIADKNAKYTQEQLQGQLANYDVANRQNSSLRDVQMGQASRKSEAERFEAQRNLQNAALGLLGSMNQAMNGSTVGNTMHMLRNRNDAENSTYWQTLQDNRNAIQNAYDESYNQNQIAKRDAAVNAIKALRDIDTDLSASLNNITGDLQANLGNIRGDLLSSIGNIRGDYVAGKRNLQAERSSNLNNINPNLYEKPKNVAMPSTGYVPSGSMGSVIGIDTNGNSNIAGNINATDWYESPGNPRSPIGRIIAEIESQLNNTQANRSRLLDYIMPANAEQQVQGYRNRLRGGNYFDRLMNGFNF